MFTAPEPPLLPHPMSSEYRALQTDSQAIPVIKAFLHSAIASWTPTMYDRPWKQGLVERDIHRKINYCSRVSTRDTGLSVL